MSRYVKKANPAFEVEAVQLTAENVSELAEWTDGQTVQEYNALDEGDVYVGINIEDPAGAIRASEGDYVILHNGQFHVRKPGHFESRYKKA